MRTNRKKKKKSNKYEPLQKKTEAQKEVEELGILKLKSQNELLYQKRKEDMYNDYEIPYNRPKHLQPLNREGERKPLKTTTSFKCSTLNKPKIYMSTLKDIKDKPYDFEESINNTIIIQKRKNDKNNKKNNKKIKNELQKKRVKFSAEELVINCTVPTPGRARIEQIGEEESIEEIPTPLIQYNNKKNIKEEEEEKEEEDDDEYSIIEESNEQGMIERARNKKKKKIKHNVKQEEKKRTEHYEQLKFKAKEKYRKTPNRSPFTYNIHTNILTTNPHHYEELRKEQTYFEKQNQKPIKKTNNHKKKKKKKKNNQKQQQQQQQNKGEEKKERTITTEEQTNETYYWTPQAYQVQNVINSSTTTSLPVQQEQNKSINMNEATSVTSPTEAYADYIGQHQYELLYPQPIYLNNQSHTQTKKPPGLPSLTFYEEEETVDTTSNSEQQEQQQTKEEVIDFIPPPIKTPHTPDTSFLDYPLFKQDSEESINIVNYIPEPVQVNGIEKEPNFLVFKQPSKRIPPNAIQKNKQQTDIYLPSLNSNNYMMENSTSSDMIHPKLHTITTENEENDPFKLAMEQMEGTQQEGHFSNSTNDSTKPNDVSPTWVSLPNPTDDFFRNQEQVDLPYDYTSPTFMDQSYDASNIFASPTTIVPSPLTDTPANVNNHFSSNHSKGKAAITVPTPTISSSFEVGSPHANSEPLSSSFSNQGVLGRESKEEPMLVIDHHSKIAAHSTPLPFDDDEESVVSSNQVMKSVQIGAPLPTEMNDEVHEPVLLPKKKKKKKKMEHDFSEDLVIGRIETNKKKKKKTTKLANKKSFERLYTASKSHKRIQRFQEKQAALLPDILSRTKTRTRRVMTAASKRSASSLGFVPSRNIQTAHQPHRESEVQVKVKKNVKPKEKINFYKSKLKTYDLAKQRHPLHSHRSMAPSRGSKAKRLNDAKSQPMAQLATYSSKQVHIDSVIPHPSKPSSRSTAGSMGSEQLDCHPGQQLHYQEAQGYRLKYIRRGHRLPRVSQGDRNELSKQHDAIYEQVKYIPDPYIQSTKEKLAKRSYIEGLDELMAHVYSPPGTPREFSMPNNAFVNPIDFVS